jgi:hypothetical protein
MSGSSDPRSLRLASAAVVALVLAACGGGGGSSDPTGGSGPTGPPTASGPRPASTAQLTIVSPTEGQTIDGGTVSLRVDLQGAEIVPATTTNIVPDEGHLHVILDEQLISMTADLAQTIPDVGPGEHLLKVEFVASDHIPFDPRVIAAVSFETTG